MRYLYYRLSRLQTTHGTLSVAIRKSRHDKQWRSKSIVAFFYYYDVRLGNCVDFWLKMRQAPCMRHQNFYTFDHRLHRLHEIGIRAMSARWQTIPTAMSLSATVCKFAVNTLMQGGVVETILPPPVNLDSTPMGG